MTVTQAQMMETYSSVQVRQKKLTRKSGISLVEILVSTTVLGFVVAGSMGSAMLFAKIAADHENRSDFANDLRNGLEQMSLDVRNAARVDDRTQSRFDLTLVNGESVSWSYNTTADEVSRSVDGNTKVVMRNVAAFDVLRDASDEPSGGALPFDEGEISIERITFEEIRGGGVTERTIENLTLKSRNI